MNKHTSYQTKDILNYAQIMTKQFLNINGGGDHLHERLRKPHIIKTYSFTTDDDDAGLGSNHEKLIPTNSPSIDSYNNNDGDSSESRKKSQKRKLKRQTEIENHIEKQIPVNLKPPWYKKSEFLRLLALLILIVLVYFMWIKRDVWINRLLTSKARVYQNGHTNDDDDQTGNSSVYSSPQEDIIENTEEKNDIAEESTSEKINLRTRKTKINLSKTSLDDSPVLPSTKKKHQRQSLITRDSRPIHVSTYDDIMEQVRKNLKSRSHQREFFSKLSKATGVKKPQLYQFIFKKNYHVITLQTFVTLLDSFDLMLVIVRK